jgi:signal transduction histidine kinase
MEAADELRIARLETGELEISAPQPFDHNNWLAASARAAAYETDAYDAELGAILHDLKNELTAVRAALAVPDDTRTGQLAAALAASRHWDAAAGLVARIADADLLFGPTDVGGVTRLSEFFREYVAQILRRTPGSIRIVPPVMSTVHADLPIALFRAVVDNLVLNAIQAIGDDNGEIRIDYEIAEGDGSVIVRISNTGPGIPDSVLRDLRLGRKLSGRGNGSGLGLNGVQRILFSVGGSLEPALGATGHTWVITLPMHHEVGEIA